MKISNEAHMLQISGEGFSINPVLVSDGQIRGNRGSLALIDAGFPGQTELFVNAIAEAGFSVHDLTHIILTHQDMDHIGCVLDLLALAPNAVVCAHTLEAPYIDGRKTPVKLAARLEKYDELPPEQQQRLDFMKQSYTERKIHVARELNHGDVLEIGGGIEVVHTPGHTPGHICLLLRDSGILVCGDSLNISEGKLTGPNPVHTFDMPLALSSAEMAKALPVRAFCTYHGGFLPVNE